MYCLVVSYKDGSKDYFGPFPTFFRANEYGLALMQEFKKPMLGLKEPLFATPTPLVLPHTMRVKFS